MEFGGRHVPAILCENFYPLRRELPRRGFGTEREKDCMFEWERFLVRAESCWQMIRQGCTALIRNGSHQQLRSVVWLREPKSSFGVVRAR